MIQKDKLKLDIFNAVEEDEDEDSHFAVVTQNKIIAAPTYSVPAKPAVLKPPSPIKSS